MRFAACLVSTSALLFSASVCAVQTPQATSQTANLDVRSETEAPRFVVIGIDRTENWETMTRPALRLAETTIRQSHPGDELVVRWISDRSYRSDETIAHIRLPAIPRKAVNPFDRQAKLELAAAKSRVQSEAVRGLQLINSQQTRPATRATDVYGFIAAAAEHFAEASPGVHKVLVIASDMGDNRKQRLYPDLRGVDVEVALVVHADPNPVRVAALKDAWTAYFSRCGAQSVKYSPIAWDSKSAS